MSPVRPASRALHVTLHGKARVQRGDVGWPLERKVSAMLCVLAVDGNTARGALATLLWPGIDETAARGNLRQRIFQLHRQAGADIVVGRQSLALAEGVSTDVGHATVGATAGVDSGLLLGSFDYADLPEFSEWLAGVRRRLAEAEIESWSAAAAAHEARGELAAAIVLAQQIVHADGLLEHAHRRLMRLHYLRGDAAAAIGAFERCEQTLRDELGVRPGAETLALLQTIESAASAAPPTFGFVPASLHRPPRVIGRRSELEALADAWLEGQAFIVVGAAGIGKSRLLAEHLSGQPGAVATQGRPGDSSVPLALVERLLRAVLSRNPRLGGSETRRVLALLLPEWAAAERPAAAASAAQIRGATVDLLAEAIADGLEAIVIDDLHFADAQSLELLQGLLGTTALAALRWGFATRPSDAVERWGVVVPLAPLDSQSLSELVASLQIAGLDGAAICDDLIRHTGGNPLFVLATLKDVIRHGAHAEAPAKTSASAMLRLPRPGSVTVLIEATLRALSPRALALARVAAVAVPDFSLSLAERVLGTTAIALADAWAELEQVQVLRGTSFAHDLIHETALGTVPHVIAIALHEHVARCLEADDAEPSHIAEHWELAGLHARAGPHWIRAAKAARTRGSALPAAALCERAVVAFDRSGDGDAAFDALCMAAGHLSYHGLTSRFAPVVERLIQRCRTGAERARAGAWAAHLADLRGAPLESVEAMLRAGLLESIASAQPAVEAEYRYSLAMVARRKGELQSAAEQFAAAATLMESLGMELEAAEARTVMGAAMAALGCLQDSTRRLEAAVPLLERHGAHNTLGYNHSRRAINAESAGRASEAAALTREALTLLYRADPGAHDWCVTGAPLIERLSLEGRYGEALELAAAARQRLTGETLSSRVMVDVAIAHLYLDLGRPELAMQASRFEGLHLDPVASARAHLLALSLERHGSAVAAIGLDFKAAARVDLRFQLRYALVAASRLAPPAAVALLQAQADVAEQSAMNGFLPALRVALAHAALDAGDRSGADAALARGRQALDAYEPATPVPALYLDLAETSRRLGDDEAAAHATRLGADWVRRRLVDVPDEFRMSMQQRNPVHRALLRAVAGEGHAPGG